MHAAYAAKPDSVRCLLKHGADPNAHKSMNVVNPLITKHNFITKYAIRCPIKNLMHSEVCVLEE